MKKQFARVKAFSIFAIIVLLLSITCRSDITLGAESAERLDLVGALGGAIKAIAIKDNLAVIGEGLSLVILDVTDPSNPVIVGKSRPLPDPITDIYISGDYAYLSAIHGIWVYDISDPSDLVLLGYLVDPRYGIVGIDLVGTRAYLAAGCEIGLLVVDVTDPNHITELGSIDSGDCADDVFVDGDYAYVADQSTGLSILDISDPTDIQIINQITLSWAAYKLTLLHAGLETYVYIVEGMYFEVVDVTDPLDIAIIYQTPISANCVAIIDNYAYVGGSFQTLIYDISQPDLPVLIGTYNLGVSNLTITPTTVYLLSGAMHILDRTDPINLQFLALFNTFTQSYEIIPDNQLAYIATGNSGLRIADITDPESPRLIGASPTSYTECDYIREIAIFNNYAYSPGPFEFRIYDIADPTDPGMQISTLAKGARIAVAGDVLVYLFAGETSFFLQVVDLTNPASPTLIRSILLPTGDVYEIDTYGRYVYIATLTGVLFVDLTDPTQAQITSIYQISANMRDIDVAYPYLYLIDDAGVLSVLDISDPGSVSAIGSLGGIYAGRIASSENYVYLAQVDAETVYAIDVSDPTTPILLTSRLLPYDLSDIAAEGKWVYVSNWSKGLFVLYLNYFNLSPTADAGGPYVATVGEIITLDASASSDPDNNIASYQWDLDQDGEYDDASGVAATTSYTHEGDYSVGLKVTDTEGLSDTDTASVTISPAPLMNIYLSLITKTR